MTNTSITGWIAKPASFELNNKVYTLSRFTRKHSDAFVEWAKKVLPNPVDEVIARIDKLPLEIQIRMSSMLTKMLSCKMTIDCPECAALFYSMDGQYKIMMLLLQANHPELTDDQAWEIIYDAYCYYGMEWFEQTLETVMGTVPELLKKKAVIQEEITGKNSTTELDQILPLQTSL